MAGPRGGTSQGFSVGSAPVSPLIAPSAVAAARLVDRSTCPPSDHPRGITSEVVLQTTAAVADQWSAATAEVP